MKEMNYYTLVIGTLIIIAFSWYFSIREKRYHGVARFFAFESIFILFLMNFRVWFVDPFSVFQIISWICLIASIYPAVAGFNLLRTSGKPEENHIERTTVVVKTGVYKYIRHPLYGSLILVGTGIMFKDPGKIQILLGIINIVALYLTSRIEEREMISKFGIEYTEYIKESKMFIPFVF